MADFLLRNSKLYTQRLSFSELLTLQEETRSDMKECGGCVFRKQISRVHVKYLNFLELQLEKLKLCHLKRKKDYCLQ